MNQRSIAIGIGVLILIGGLVYFLISMNSRGQLVGGPCTYETNEYPAQIYSIDTIGNNELSLGFIVETIEFSDTINYYNGIEFEEIEHLNLTLNTVLIYRQRRIIEGSCNPLIGQIILEEFK